MFNKKENKDWLIAFMWESSISLSSGNSSIIVSLSHDDKMNREKIKTLQREILAQIEDSDNDISPDSVVITAVSALAI